MHGAWSYQINADLIGSFLTSKQKYNFKWNRDACSWRSYGWFTGFQVVLCAVLKHLHLFIHWVMKAYFTFFCLWALFRAFYFIWISEKLLKEGSSFLWLMRCNDACLSLWLLQSKTSPHRLEHCFAFCSYFAGNDHPNRYSFRPRLDSSWNICPFAGRITTCFNSIPPYLIAM